MYDVGVDVFTSYMCCSDYCSVYHSTLSLLTGIYIYIYIHTHVHVYGRETNNDHHTDEMGHVTATKYYLSRPAKKS